MNRSCTYAAVLDAVGFYVERAGGTDVLVQELEDGVLLSFVAKTAQQVMTLTPSELARLSAAATRPGMTALLGARRRDPDDLTTRARLRAAGRYLDRRKASAIVVQEHGRGCCLGFTGLPEDRWDERMGLTRLDAALDDAHLHRLLAQPKTA